MQLKTKFGQNTKTFYYRSQDLPITIVNNLSGRSNADWYILYRDLLFVIWKM